MSQEMTKYGVGSRFTILSVIYGLILVLVSIFFDPVFKIPYVPYKYLVMAGVLLIVAGFPFYLSALVGVMRAFEEKKLLTNGSFGMCRHPVYAAWVVFFVPAIMLFFNTWLGLTAPVFMYVLIRVLVDKEEIYLEEMFGEAYLIYRKRVPLVLPIGWLKRG